MNRHQFFIASYRRDFEWLGYCLQSLKKFSVGFLPPVVALDGSDMALARQKGFAELAELKRFDGPGFGRAQAAMMSSELLCPDASYIYLIGSDTFAIREFDYTAFWRTVNGDSRPVMLYNSYAHLRKINNGACMWHPGTVAALGPPCEHEFMRRLPLVYPRQVYAPCRDAIRDWHKTPFFAYVIHAVNKVKNFSESNVLGEFAWRNFRESYHWFNCDLVGYPEPKWPFIQGWSHGGLDQPCDKHPGKTAREIIEEALKK
jgi:hypothetical protein